MPYTHFRYIAYEVPTATMALDAGGNFTGNVISGYPPGNASPAVATIPVPALPNPLPDWHVRLLRLAAAVDLARQNLGAGDNANTLKVFVAPEFYFRPPAAGRADYANDTYPQADMLSIWGVLDTMFANVLFADWLIVPGTVMWNRHVPTAADAQRRNYFNSVLYVRGGAAQTTRLIEKQLPSGIDGIPRAYAPGNDALLKPIYQDWRVRAEHIIRVDGKDYGVEVCLDHYNSNSCRVLKQVLYEWPGRYGDLSNAQRAALVRNPELALHILTAGGMPLEMRSVAARVGGYILRNDGWSVGVHSELRRVQSYTFGPFNVAPSNTWGSATLAADPGTAVAVPIPAGPEQVPPYANDPNPAHYHTFAQRLQIYPAVALP